jgi:hypothetical protein
MPDSKEQVAVKKRFAWCVKYAKAAIKDPVIKAAYAADDKRSHTQNCLFAFRIRKFKFD